jgi:hypothetical protein
MAQRYASWATLVRRFINLLEQTDNFTIFELDGICSWNLWQAWHCHDVASYDNYELGTSAQSDLPNRNSVARWRTLGCCIC